MKTLKNTLLIVSIITCYGLAVFTIVFIYQTTNPSPRETALLNILLFLLSTVASLITGYYFARVSTSEKIDTIGERSSEKMVNFTSQLLDLEGYLRDTAVVAQDEGGINIHAALNAYRHRTDAAASMAANLASTNESFRSDWLGVVSDSARKVIEANYKKLRSVTRKLDEIVELEQKERSASGSEDESLRKTLEKARQELESLKESLPIRAFVARSPENKAPAVAVDQQVEMATPERNKGVLRIKILRPVPSATGSGKLAPRMGEVPGVTIKPIKVPEGAALGDFRYTVGTGTNYDFNITIGTSGFGDPLPTGEYHFEYEAAAMRFL